MPPRVDTETDPLLPSPAIDNQHVLNETKSDHEAAVVRSKIAWQPILLINLLFVLNGLGYFISVAPQTQLFENLLCDAYYRSSASRTTPTQPKPSRDPCKVPAVQEPLAIIFGFQTFFNGILVCFCGLGAILMRHMHLRGDIGDSTRDACLPLGQNEAQINA